MGKMRFLICLILMVLVTGCAGSKKPDILIDYRRTGGLAGFNDHLTINMDGSAVLQRRNNQVQFTLDQGTLNRLEILFNNASFSKLKKNYSPAQPGADLFEYTLTYRGYTVQMMDTAIPEELQPILQSLNQ